MAPAKKYANDTVDLTCWKALTLESFRYHTAAGRKMLDYAAEGLKVYYPASHFFPATIDGK